MHAAAAYLPLLVQLNRDFWLLERTIAFYFSFCHSEKCLWNVLYLNRCELEPESLISSQFKKLGGHSAISERWASLLRTEMDSPEQFKETIYQYYKNVVTDEFPERILNGVVSRLTEEFFEQYMRFKKQYPKSAKRYSTFHVKDLDHPQTFESIIEFLKTNVKADYKKYAGELLNLNDSEVTNFEKSREDFYNMF